jgi:hypothetical protein
MYANRNNIIFGFHGCDKDVCNELVSGKIPFNASHNAYDWLGYGRYFWENNYKRAEKWAVITKEHPQNNKQVIKEPAVLGVAICLGRCLDLTDSEFIHEVKTAYTSLASIKSELPVNAKGFLRYLDCAVIEAVHTMRKDLKLPPYDSVRSVFWEGTEPYDGAGFRDKNHIQICIRNPNCIKGLFLPRTAAAEWIGV